MCYACGCTTFNRSPAQKREDKVFEFIAQNYSSYEIRYDNQLPNQDCSKARPDVLFLLSHRKLIVECDENSHKAGAYSCEAKRMSDLAAAGDIIPTVFIRFNPDLYRDSDSVKRVITIPQRLEKLKKEIDYWLDVETTQDHFITAVYMYYDQSEIREQGFVPCDWTEQIDQ
jgi:hypothetical protein